MGAYGQVTGGFWPAVAIGAVLVIVAVVAVGGAARQALRRFDGSALRRRSGRGHGR